MKVASLSCREVQFQHLLIVLKLCIVQYSADTLLIGKFGRNIQIEAKCRAIQGTAILSQEAMARLLCSDRMQSTSVVYADVHHLMMGFVPRCGSLRQLRSAYLMEKLRTPTLMVGTTHPSNGFGRLADVRPPDARVVLFKSLQTDGDKSSI